MKKILFLLCYIITFNISNNLYADTNPLEFSFFSGLSIPNNTVSKFFNKEVIMLKIDSLESTGKFITNSASNLGYHIGIRLRKNMSENTYLYGGIALHRFNQGIYNLYLVDNTDNNDAEEMIATFYSTTNIIPISIGINYYLIKELMGIYILGNISYNIISTSIDYEVKKIITLPYKISSNKARPGFDIGAGIDFDLELLLLNFEGRYNFSNIIGNDSDEPYKNYATITIGVTF